MEKKYIVVGCVMAACLFIFGMKNKRHADHIREIIITRCMDSSASEKDVRWAIQDIDNEIKRIYFLDTGLANKALLVLQIQQIELESEEKMMTREQEQLDDADIYLRADIRERIAQHKRAIAVINTTASEKLKTLLSIMR